MVYHCSFLSGGGPCNFTMQPVSVSQPSAPSRRQTLNPLPLATLTVTPPALSRSTGTTVRQRSSQQGRSTGATISDQGRRRREEDTHQTINLTPFLNCILRVNVRIELPTFYYFLSLLFQSSVIVFFVYIPHAHLLLSFVNKPP